MRIRTQLLIALAFAMSLAFVAVLLVVSAAREEDRASMTLARALSTSHEVSGLLVLTQEYARHADDRAAQQWHQRHRAIAVTLVREVESASGNPALHELRAVTQSLQQLFTRLEDIGKADDAFSLRRKEVLLDQLLTSTQAMSDHAYQWYQDAALVRSKTEREFQLAALAMPVSMLVLVVLLAAVVRQRVLLPLARLDDAAAAIGRGDLTARIASLAFDELGDLSRRFDRMAAALAQSTAQVRQSEKQLRAVTDNLPALIAYVDRDEVFRFANAHHKTVFGVEPESFVGNTFEQNVKPQDYAALKGEIHAALRGERRQFERSGVGPNRDMHTMLDFIPDLDEEGAVAGFYTMVADITARKNAELAQAQSERFLRLITDNLPTLIAYVDKEEHYRFANAHYRGMLNMDPKALIGTTVSAGLRPETLVVLRPYINAALAGERQRFERCSVIGGKAIHLRTDYIPDRAEDGSVLGLVSMVVDITELKEAQLAHAREEERVRSILTHAPDAFISIDAGGRIREWNRQAEVTFGWKREEVLGQLIATVLIPPEHRQAHNAEIAHFAATGEGPVINQRIETSALHKAGHEIPIELSIAPVREGGTFAANAFLRDISVRKQAEKQLRDSEQRLRDITNHIPAMVGHFDRQERCLFANNTVLKQLGLTPNEVANMSLRLGLGEANYALHEPHVRKVLQGELCNFEGHVQHRGRDAFFQAHLVPDRSSDGVLQGFYLMSFDVTAMRLADLARVRSEERLRQITDNLPVLISYLDKEQRLQFANATYNTWLGIDPQGVIGRFSRDVFGPTLYEMRQPYIERALQGERVEFEDEATVNGVVRATSVCYIPDMDGDGHAQGIYTLTTDVTELKTVERRLHAQARFDTLTGLPNRLLYNEKLPEVLARADRMGSAVALMFLDIDHFKSINDSLGHAAGDTVLKIFAKRLTSSVRLTDTVARLAGDEFVVILENLHNDTEPQFVARKIVAMVNEPFDVEGRPLDVTTSIGIAYQDGSMPPTTPSKLLANADDALYQAKAAGRNTYRLATREASVPGAKGGQSNPQALH